MKKKPSGLKPAPPGDRTVDISTSNGIRISEYHIPQDDFDNAKRTPKGRIGVGARLIRAANAVYRQGLIDNAALHITRERGKSDVASGGDGLPAGNFVPQCGDIGLQAVFLAALALENGLKGLLIARGSGASILGSHSLEDLAKEYGFQPIGEVEQQCIKHGALITEFLGRYPTPKEANQWPISVSLNVTGLMRSYQDLFFRCVDEMERNFPATEVRLELFREYASYVFPPEEFEVERHLKWANENARPKGMKPL